MKKWKSSWLKWNTAWVQRGTFALILGLAVSLCAETPDAFLRYVEATGQQAVDVGVRGRYGTKMEIQLEWTGLGDMSILDARESLSTESRVFFAHSSGSGTITLGYGTYHWTQYNDGGTRNYSWEIGRKYKVETDYSVVTNIVVAENVVTNLVEDPENPGVTNEVEETVTETTTNITCKASYLVDGQNLNWGQTVFDLLDTGVNLYLFACNIGDTPHYMAKAKCYGLKIWQDGILVRDFKPCVKDGWAMLYDTETRALYCPVPLIPAKGNVGAYQPTGEEKPEYYLDWVDTDGTQYIDTGVTARDGTAAEFEMEWKQFAYSSDWEFLGARTSGNRRFLMWHVVKNALSYGYNSFWYPDSRNPAATVGGDNANKVLAVANHKYHVSTALDNGSQVITADGTTIVNRTDTDGVNAGCNLYIFADDKAGTAQFFCQARLYWLKIWQDGFIMRDFRPVLLDNGWAALWDARHNEIYSPNKPFSAVGPVGNKVVIHYGTMLFIK